MLTILIERWRPHPLAWIHRAEARAIAAELRAAGETVRIAVWDERSPRAGTAGWPQGGILIRMSDPVMLPAVRALAAAGIGYCGPDAGALARCYDKAQAYAIAQANGIDCPHTLPASAADAMPRPLVLKPRCGSDSIGLRLLRAGAIPRPLRARDYLAQELVRGTELTVAVLGGEAGAPLRIDLAPGTPYTFRRKYLFAPRKLPLQDAALGARVRVQALRIASLFGMHWAARIDFIHEHATGRLMFLECDAAPLVGPGSAFAASLGAGGMVRAQQLRRLLTVRPSAPRMVASCAEQPIAS